MFACTRASTLVLGCILSAPGAAVAQDADYYVDDNTGDDNNNGREWATAWRTLQHAIDNANPGDEIIVAHGVYGPAQAGSTGVTVVLRKETRLHGGFIGPTDPAASTNPNEPDGSFLQTQISGLSGDTIPPPTGTPTLDSGPVVECIGHEGRFALLDGFVVQYGDVDETDNRADSLGGGRGGGLFVQDPMGVRIENVTFRFNSALRTDPFHPAHPNPAAGGAVYVSGGAFGDEACSIAEFGLEIDRCTFYQNFSEDGAALYLGPVAGVKMCNSVFYDNSADNEAAPSLGGAIHLSPESFLLAANCLIHDNHADRGGGVYIEPSTVAGETVDFHTFRHCTISRNTSVIDGGGMLTGAGIHMAPSASSDCEVSLHNSIVWGNLAGLDVVREPGGLPIVAEASDVGPQSGVDLSAPSNLSNVDPEFVNPAGGNFVLSVSPLSPCIDAGNGLLTGPDFVDLDEDGDEADPLPFDLRGADRASDHPAAPGTDVDMGAYERHGGG